MAAFHCDSWEGYRTFESLEAERNNAMASYADQIQEANAARFVHNLDANHCNIWISQEAQNKPKAVGQKPAAFFLYGRRCKGVTAV